MVGGPAPGLRQTLGGLRLAPLPLDEAASSLWRATVGGLRGPFAEEPAAADELWAAPPRARGAVGAGLAARHAVGRLALAVGLLPMLGMAALMLLGRDPPSGSS